MKKQYILIMLIVFNLISSCVVEEERIDITYQVKNTTGYNVVIRAFEAHIPIGDYIDITILNDDIYVGEKLKVSANFGDSNNIDNVLPAASFNSSCLIVVYNNERKTEHLRIDTDGDDRVDAFPEPINRHLLRGGNYTHIGNDIYEFVLTQEDYNNATPCEGDCLD